MCVSKLCVSRLYVSKLCVSRLYVSKLCVCASCVWEAAADGRRTGRRRRTGGGRDAEPKTRTPHKDVGKHFNGDFELITINHE